MKRGIIVAGLVLSVGWMPAALSASAEAPAVAVVSGGIGEGDQQRLLSRQNEYNLKLVFTLNEGNYVADVNVVVKDGAGRTVVEHMAGGPLFLAKLPAGRYTVAATYEGKTVTRNVQVADKGLRTDVLRWPSDPEKDFAAARH